MRLYLSLADFTDTAIGTYWTSKLGATTIARSLARGSRAADTIIRGHLGQPGVTTLAASVSPGATTLSLASVVNIDGGDVVDLGGGQERIQVSGVQVTSWTAPYPGIVTLMTPTSNGYSSGAAVQGMYRERWSARGGSTNTMELSGPLTQEGQTAQAHAPEAGYTDLVRTIFLGATPVSQLETVAVVYRFGGTPVYLTTVNLALNVLQGWYRLPLGMYVPQGSDIETTYLGGYGFLPDDAQQAVGLLAADDLATSNPMLALGFTQTKTADQAVSAVIVRDPSGKSLLRARAEAYLTAYTRLV